jgi:hypothetical protein
MKHQSSSPDSTTAMVDKIANIVSDYYDEDAAGRWRKCAQHIADSLTDEAATPGITGHQYRRARYEEPAATPTEPLRDALGWLVNCVECEVNLPGTTTVFQLRLAKAKEALAAPAQPVAATPPRYIVDGLPELPDDDADFTPYLARKIIAKYQEILRGAAQPPSTADAEREWTRLNDVFHKALQQYPYSQHALHYLWNNTIARPGGTVSSTPLCTPSPQDRTR